jgi:UDP-GlcNAc:undecaprenyl-phosphate GlcNAc-1-phosphate transferase
MEALVIIIVSAAGMLGAMAVFAPLAPRIGLLDHPDEVRKLHDGAIPLIGGPALLLVLLAAIALFADAFASAGVLAGVAALTVLIGSVDDCLDLSPSGRLLFMLGLAGLVTLFGGVSITHLGDLAGTGSDLPLGWLGPWITVGAIAAAMNAFNMLDGTDGQASGLALVAAAAIAGSALLAGAALPPIALVLLGALPVFLVFNHMPAGAALPKSFLGDSGALLLGLLTGWLLISSAQAPAGWLDPVTVLWFAAVPLFDTLFVMSYRMLHRRSPLSPDRNHVHHLLQDYGFSRLATLVMVLSSAAVFAAAGLALQQLSAPEVLSFLTLFGLFLGYLSAALYLHRRRPFTDTGSMKAIEVDTENAKAASSST